MKDEDFQKLKSDLTTKHGERVLVVKISDGRVFAFKPANAADWRRWKGAQMGLLAGRTAEAASASELAARSLCVYPEDKGAAFDALRDEAPNVASDIGDVLIGRVGAGVEADLGEA